MTSAVCTVNGITLAIANVSGIQVAGGSTITVQLTNTSNVKSWSINCTNSDGYNPTSVPAYVNTSKTQNNITFTATFTAPDIYLSWFGSANQFISIVNQGEVDQAIFYFGVWVIGETGNRLFFTGESYESNATYGIAYDSKQTIQFIQQ